MTTTLPRTTMVLGHVHFPLLLRSQPFSQNYFIRSLSRRVSRGEHGGMNFPVLDQGCLLRKFPSPTPWIFHHHYAKWRQGSLLPKMRWRSFCGMNSIFGSRIPVLSGLLHLSAGRKRWLDKGQRNKTPICETSTYTIYRIFSHHLVYVDESGCDKRIGFRRTGWSPVGTTPLQVSKFHRNQHCQILPTYAQDGVIFSQVFQGSTNTAVFVDFIKHLLKYCGKWPEPKSVLVIDNTSFHHSERIKEPYSNAGVKLVYLPPYSPNLNPIKELFSKLKAFIRQN